MKLLRIEHWEWIGLVLGLIGVGITWCLVRCSGASDLAPWIALGPLLIGLVGLAAARFKTPILRMTMRISVPLALIWYVGDIYSTLYHPRTSTAALGLPFAPMIGLMGLFLVFPFVGAASWFYQTVVRPNSGNDRE